MTKFQAIPLPAHRPTDPPPCGLRASMKAVPPGAIGYPPIWTTSWATKRNLPGTSGAARATPLSSSMNSSMRLRRASLASGLQELLGFCSFLQRRLELYRDIDDIELDFFQCPGLALCKEGFQRSR